MPDVVLMLAIWAGGALWQRGHGRSPKNRGAKDGPPPFGG